MISVLLTGANGVVGLPLSERLHNEGIKYSRVSREPASNLLQWDLHHEADQPTINKLVSAELNVLIHCAPIWLLSKHLPVLKEVGIRRIVAFSSSSVSSKSDSKDVSESKLVAQLLSAEQSTKEFCLAHGIDLTLFRPTLIYGYKRDQNISHIAKFINKYGFFVVVGKAQGLRQPVHADDLVDASLSVIENQATFAKTYYLAGAETLTYDAMVRRIFDGLNRKAKVISLPLSVFRWSLKIAAKVASFSYTPDMANRMNQNLSYDITSAKTDFSYEPQSFLTDPQRDLPEKVR